MKSAISLPFLLAVLIFAAGCSKNDQWWIGKWQFDEAATKSHLAQSEQNKDGMTGPLAPMLFAMFADSQMAITKDQIFLMKDGSGTAKTYSVIERPSPNQAILRAGENVSTYGLEGEHLTILSTGDVRIKLYFKRVKP
jgi:hypothetical protein